jgi:hypothetical protein
MERRGFLRGLLMGAPALALPIPAIPEDSHPARIVESWWIKWTGWKDFPNGTMHVGQWIAYPKCGTGVSVYASHPGATGWFVPDQLFDISRRHGQYYLTQSSPKNLFELAEEESFHRLKKYLDIAGPAPLTLERARTIKFNDL